MVGLYGVVSYGVTRRQRKMGVRLALGAKGGAFRGLVIGQSLKLVGLGLLAAAMLASALPARRASRVDPIPVLPAE